MLAYRPYVACAAAIWLVVAYLFDDAMVRRATAARSAMRAEEERDFTICSEPLHLPRHELYVIDVEVMNA